MIMQCIYIYVKIIFVHPVSGVSIYRSKCNENSYKTKKKDISCTCKHFKIYLLDLDCHIICDILTSTFSILLEAAFKRKKKGSHDEVYRDISAIFLQLIYNEVFLVSLNQPATLMEIKYLNCFDYSVCTVLVFAAYEEMSITGHLILDFMTNNSNKMSVGNFNILDLNDI